MFQDIINYGNRQGGKQAIADCGIKKERNLEVQGLRDWVITIPKPEMS